MQEVDDESVSVEERVQGALEEVQDRLKQLQKTTREQVSPTHKFSSLKFMWTPSFLHCVQSMTEHTMNTLKPIVMSRQVSISPS